jgi:hypothetical protein
LSNPELRVKENQRYIALQVGDPPFCNAVMVSNSDRVKFIIQSEDLLKRAGEHFEPIEVSGEKRRFTFYGLTINDIQDHEPLFRELVQESIGTEIGQKPKGSGNLR